MLAETIVPLAVDLVVAGAEVTGSRSRTFDTLDTSIPGYDYDCRG